MRIYRPKFTFIWTLVKESMRVYTLFNLMMAERWSFKRPLERFQVWPWEIGSIKSRAKWLCLTLAINFVAALTFKRNQDFSLLENGYTATKCKERLWRLQTATFAIFSGHSQVKNLRHQARSRYNRLWVRYRADGSKNS